jgi:UDP-glucose 4-epimerase
VQANLLAADAVGVSGAFNIGSGTRITINGLIDLLRDATEQQPDIRTEPPRPGDVRHSLADIGAAHRAFGYKPAVDLASGLKEYVEWAKSDVATLV